MKAARSVPTAPVGTRHGGQRRALRLCKRAGPEHVDIGLSRRRGGGGVHSLPPGPSLGGEHGSSSVLEGARGNPSVAGGRGPAAARGRGRPCAHVSPSRPDCVPVTVVPELRTCVGARTLLAAVCPFPRSHRPGPPLSAPPLTALDPHSAPPHTLHLFYPLENLLVPRPIPPGTRPSRARAGEHVHQHEAGGAAPAGARRTLAWRGVPRRSRALDEREAAAAPLGPEVRLAPD